MFCWQRCVGYMCAACAILGAQAHHVWVIALLKGRGQSVWAAPSPGAARVPCASQLGRHHCCQHQEPVEQACTAAHQALAWQPVRAACSARRLGTGSAEACCWIFEPCAALTGCGSVAANWLRCWPGPALVLRLIQQLSERLLLYAVRRFG